MHPEILRGQGLPHELVDEKNLWKRRYRSIVDLEEHLDRNGTRIMKVFPHLSKDEQRNSSSTASMSRTRTGNSASRTSTSGNTGNITSRFTRTA